MTETNNALDELALVKELRGTLDLLNLIDARMTSCRSQLAAMIARVERAAEAVTDDHRHQMYLRARDEPMSTTVAGQVSWAFLEYAQKHGRTAATALMPALMRAASEVSPVLWEQALPKPANQAVVLALIFVAEKLAVAV